MDWKLNKSQFTLADRVKLAWFVLSDDQWTQSKHTLDFEQKMAQFVGSKYAVFVANGSLANTLIAMRLRDQHVAMRTGNTVVFPSTTWMTSVSPFIREGFDPHFIDVNLSDLSMDLDGLEKYLKKSGRHVALVFVTALLGFNPDIERLQMIADKYKVSIMMDNCENTLGVSDGKNISSYFTSTTSTYFGHQLQSVEGGFVFTNDDAEYEYFLMARCHGLVRGLPQERQVSYRNSEVDQRFDFYTLGNNFRNSDIHAFIGKLDMKRIGVYRCQRDFLYTAFRDTLNKLRVLDKFILPSIKTYIFGDGNFPFCIPIILSENNPEMSSMLLKFAATLGVETRPICTGNIVRQTPFMENYKPDEYPNSEHLHNNGFYIGLHAKIDVGDVKVVAEKFAKSVLAYNKR